MKLTINNFVSLVMLIFSVNNIACNTLIIKMQYQY